MRLLFIAAIGALGLFTLSACAQSRKGTGAAPAFTVTEATQQRTIMGRMEAGKFTMYRFAIVWKGKTAPAQIFFRPDATTWLDLQAARKERKPMFEGSSDYMVIERNVALKDFRAGSELMLSSDRHEHEIMPPSVKKMPVSAIYFTTAAAPNRWQVVPVSVKKLPDIQGM